MSDLKPSVKQMLEIGEGCGLVHIDEAYSNYLNHYDCFFYIPEYHQQHAEFVEELTKLGFVVSNADGKKELVNITIVDALAKMETHNATTPTA